jgi:hypothetical protein
MSAPRLNLSPVVCVVALVALALVLAHPAFAVDALSTADQNIQAQKSNVKNIMQDIIGVALIVAIGTGAYTVLMERNTKVIVTCAVGLLVAAIAGAVIVAM